MVILEEELGRRPLARDGRHATVTLVVEATVLTKDGLIWSSMVPVSGGLGEAMAAGVEATREREREREREITR